MEQDMPGAAAPSELPSELDKPGILIKQSLLNIDVWAG